MTTTTPAVDNFRNTDIVIMEESDAKNTNAYIDDFQRRKKMRIVGIASGALLVLGVAVAVIFATQGETTDSSQSSGQNSNGGLRNNETLVGGHNGGSTSGGSFTTTSTPELAEENGAHESISDIWTNSSTVNGLNNTDSNSTSSNSTIEDLSASTAPVTTAETATTAPTTEAPTTEAPRTTQAPTTAAPTNPPNTPSPPTNPPVTPAPVSPPTQPPTAPPTNPPTNPPTQPPATPSPKPSGGDLKEQVLHQMKVIRAAHGLGPVSWNADLAAKMQAWADSCPQKNGGGHGGPAGSQNLAGYDPCGTHCMKAPGPAWTWYDSEEDEWNYDTNKAKDGNWMTTGHFQNSMDPGVNQVACGWSSCFNPTIGKDDPLIWCNYLGGNNGIIPRPKIPKATIKAQLTA